MMKLTIKEYLSMPEHGEFSNPEMDHPQESEHSENFAMPEEMDVEGLESLDLDTPLQPEEAELLCQQLTERATDILRRHPDTTSVRHEDERTLITGSNLVISKKLYPKLFADYHLEPFEQIILESVQDESARITIEAVEANGDVHSIGIGDTQQLETETLLVESGETTTHPPMVADALFLQDALGALEASLPKADLEHADH